MNPATARRPRTLAAYFALTLVTMASVFPLYWSFVMSTSDNSVVGNRAPALLPGGHLLDNLGAVFGTVDFWGAIRNSLIVASTVAGSNVVLAGFAGFAFARLRFPGRNALFLVVIGSMMVPAQLGVIPLYILVGDLGWTGELPAVIVPGLVSAFSVFWMRQSCEEAVPAELVDAARTDGCSLLGVYWHVAVPALRPRAAVLAMLSFMTAWNDFFWPLIVLDPNETPTLQVVVSRLASGRFTNYSLMLTGATLGAVPVIALFLLLSRRVVDGMIGGRFHA